MKRLRSTQLTLKLIEALEEEVKLRDYMLKIQARLQVEPDQRRIAALVEHLQDKQATLERVQAEIAYWRAEIAERKAEVDLRSAETELMSAHDFDIRGPVYKPPARVFTAPAPVTRATPLAVRQASDVGRYRRTGVSAYSTWTPRSGSSRYIKDIIKDFEY